MSRGLSDLQERIIAILWEKRCRFEWKKDTYRDEWIGRMPQEEWEAKFPDTSYRTWTKQQLREYESDDNWLCKLDNCSNQGRLYSELIPVDCSDSERKKLVTVVGRAIQRLQERGLLTRAGRHERSLQIQLTSWGSLYGWLLSEGRMTPKLRAKKHVSTKASQKVQRARLDELTRTIVEINAITTGVAPRHEQIIDQIRQLSSWEQQAILDELKLMVETDPLVPDSTDKGAGHANG